MLETFAMLICYLTIWQMRLASLSQATLRFYLAAMEKNQFTAKIWKWPGTRLRINPTLSFYITRRILLAILISSYLGLEQLNTARLEGIRP